MLNNIDVVILNGGMGSRMNYQNKGLLKIENQTFITKLIDNFSNFNILYATKENNEDPRLKPVYDIYPNQGPISGIHSGLANSENEYIFFTPVDTPFVDENITRILASYTNEHKNVYIKNHPSLCLIHRHSLNVVEKQIKNNDNKLFNLMDQLNAYPVDYDSNKLININTESQYQELFTPFVFSVSGFKNTFKTKMVTKLINEFINDEIDIAVIKHDGHDFQMDYENTDTYKYHLAGAKDITIINDTKMANYNYQTNDIYDLIKQHKSKQVIILEGFKNYNFPKIEMIKPGEKSSLENVFLTVGNEITVDDIKQIYSIVKTKYEEHYANTSIKH